MDLPENGEQQSRSRTLGAVTAEALQTGLPTNDNEYPTTSVQSEETNDAGCGQDAHEIDRALGPTLPVNQEGACRPPTNTDSTSLATSIIATAEQYLSAVVIGAASPSHITSNDPQFNPTPPESQISTVSTASATPRRGPPRKHIMISYNHESSRDICQRIRTELRRNGYDVWLDEDNLNNSVLPEALANAIENSYIFLPCFNTKYANSMYCRKEAAYAIQKGIRLVPCRMEEGFTASGWLGFAISEYAYIDFFDEVQFDNAMALLIRRIEHIEAELQRDAAANTFIPPTTEVTTTNNNPMVNQNLQEALRIVIHEFRRSINQTYNESHSLRQDEIPQLIQFIRQHNLNNNTIVDSNNVQIPPATLEQMCQEITMRVRNIDDILTRVANMISMATEPRTIVKLSVFFMCVWTIGRFLKHE